MAQDFSSREVSLEAVMATGCGEVYRYWEAKRAGRFAPAWDEFHLVDLPSDIIPYIRVADVINDGDDFLYLFWGTGLATIRAMDRTGMRLSAIKSLRTETALAEYRRIVQDKSCFTIVYDARSGEGRLSLHAPSIRLPLSSDGETVDKIVCYTDFDTDGAEWQRFFEQRNTGTVIPATEPIDSRRVP